MNVLARPTMTLEQFLAWEEQQEERWEFDGLRPVAMTGGTEAHALIQANLIRVVGNKLVGKPCRIYGSHLKVATAKSMRYPDAFVTCSAFRPQSTVATQAVVVFEVLSPSTRAEDLIHKSSEYRATASVQRYVVLEQTQISVTVFSRKDELWVADTLAGVDAVLDLPEIDVSLSLREIYADVALDQGAEPASGA